MLPLFIYVLNYLFFECEAKNSFAQDEDSLHFIVDFSFKRFFFFNSVVSRGQWAGSSDLYGKEEVPALHESPSYG